jgi:hypothetical protein
MSQSMMRYYVLRSDRLIPHIRNATRFILSVFFLTLNSNNPWKQNSASTATTTTTTTTTTTRNRSKDSKLRQ